MLSAGPCPQKADIREQGMTVSKGFCPGRAKLPVCLPVCLSPAPYPTWQPAESPQLASRAGVKVKLHMAAPVTLSSLSLLDEPLFEKAVPGFPTRDGLLSSLSQSPSCPFLKARLKHSSSAHLGVLIPLHVPSALVRSTFSYSPLLTRHKSVI